MDTAPFNNAALGFSALPDIDAGRLPVVRLTDTNEAMADSRDVAEYFGKEHRRVLQSIRELHCSDDFRRHNFVPFKIKDLTGETTSHVEMTKDGFTFLAMGFTGGRAAIWKERYIAAFNVMEAELRKRTMVPAHALPQSFADALRLAADQADHIAKQDAAIATLAPKGEFVDRFVEAGGRYGLQNAGRALGCRPNKFIDWLKAEGFIFYADGSLVPRQQYLQAKLFEVKNTVGQDDKVHTQAFVTPKGVTYFATRIPSSIRSTQPTTALAAAATAH